MGDHVRQNRSYWDVESAQYQSDHSVDLTDRALAWGVWRIPEEHLGALGQLDGRRVLELGCGGGQFSAALNAQGVAVVGLDVSGAQLAHARAHAPLLPLVHASAEDTPFADGSFDVVFCDHGAMNFCDPDRTLPEVARLLRPGGRLAFSTSSRLRFVCMTDDWELTTSLQQDWFGDPRLDDGSSVDFSLSPGDWIGRFRKHGFVIRALHELRPPVGASTTYPWFVEREWAERWPAEELWVVDRAS
jgi:SAM-dependent methyltransferase